MFSPSMDLSGGVIWVVPQARAASDDQTNNDAKKLLQKAFKVKAQYVSALSAASAMIRTIEVESAWEWARNNKFFQDLKESVTKAQDHTTGFFAMFVLSHNQAEVNKEFKNDNVAFLSNLSHFVAAETFTDQMSRHVQRLQNMHKVAC